MPKIIEDEQIFRAVLQIVSERGYAGATTRQMAEAADVSEVTLFRKFESKAQLVKMAVSFIIAETNFSSSVRYSGDIHADLLRVVQAYQDTAVSHGLFIFSLFADLARHPELIDSMKEPFGIFRTFGKLIARYQSEGILQSEHPLHAVAKLLAPLIYISTIRNTGMDNELPDLDLSEHVAAFLKGHCVDRNGVETLLSP